MDGPVLAFSADGALLAVSGSDGSVRVWETAAPGLPAAVLPVGDGPVLRLEFSGSGGRLSIATPHLAARPREMRPDRAADALCARAGGGLTEAEWRRYVPSVPYRDVCGP
ncbi:WD40 repeat domain-containing protein [Streptomyces spinoverrucosus]|nr:WD40 repeat domain-containing protein [Streptomyces spinoverrucosus]